MGWLLIIYALISIASVMKTKCVKNKTKPLVAAFGGMGAGVLALLAIPYVEPFVSVMSELPASYQEDPNHGNSFIAKPPEINAWFSWTLEYLLAAVIVGIILGFMFIRTNQATACAAKEPQDELSKGLKYARIVLQIVSVMILSLPLVYAFRQYMKFSGEYEELTTLFRKMEEQEDALLNSLHKFGLLLGIDRIGELHKETPGAN